MNSTASFWCNAKVACTDFCLLNDCFVVVVAVISGAVGIREKRFPRRDRILKRCKMMGSSYFGFNVTCSIVLLIKDNLQFTEMLISS